MAIDNAPWKIAGFAGVILASLSAPMALAQVTDADKQSVVQAFLQLDCSINSFRNGARAEAIAGLDTLAFSLALEELIDDGTVSLDEDTFDVTLIDDRCP